MSGVHADVAPSFLATVVECPGALALSRPYRAAPETDVQKQGRIAHLVAMAHAMGNAPFYPFGANVDGVRIDAEMIAGAKLYAEALEGFAGNPEQTIPITRVHPTACFGTPDFWQYAANTKTLRVTDYKYGHLYVDVFENYQLIAYVAGLLDILENAREPDGVTPSWPGFFEHETIIEFMIVQPRCYSADSPVRTWTTSATNLRSYINKASNAVEDALGPNPKTKAGTHCLFCPARAVCKTAHIASTAIIEYAGNVEAMAQSAHEVGLRLNLVNAALEVLKAVSSGLEEQAMSLLRKGSDVPFWALDYTKPRETWAKTPAEVKTLGMLSGKVLTEETFAVTPKQAVKMGIDRAVISKYSTTPNGSAKLVHKSLTDVAKIFRK